MNQPLDYVQDSPPGIFRTWRGMLTSALAVVITLIGAFAFGWVIWCVLARIFT